MLNSYKSISGKVTKIKLIISGGVIMAAKIISTTKECLLYCLKKAGDIKPNLLKKYTKIGNKNTIPFAKQTVVTVEINEFRFIWFAT